MKKSTKACLICGGAMLLFGCVISFISAAIGADGYHGRFLHIGSWNNDFGIIRFTDENYVTSNTASGAVTEYAVTSDKGYSYTPNPYSDGGMRVDFVGDMEEFSNLNLTNSVSDVTMTQDGEQGFVYVENIPSDKISIKVQNGVLIVKEDNYNIFPLNIGNQEPRSIVINLPPTINLELLELHLGVGDFEAVELDLAALEITAGVGDVNLTNISLNVLDYKGGVGDFTADNLACRKNIDIETGVGSVLINGIVGDNASFKCGVGSTYFHGTIGGDIEVNGDVGEVDVMLNGNPNDYYYNIKKGISSITINGEDMKSDTKSWGSKDAPQKVTLNGGIGSITVHVEDMGILS